MDDAFAGRSISQMAAPKHPQVEVATVAFTCAPNQDARRLTAFKTTRQLD